jgi:DNA-binding transcriptional regulator YdaS (Cro superfamily)
MVIGDLIQALGGTTAVARALSVNPSVVSNWRGRQSIPSEHWPAIVDLAIALKVPDITFETLSRAHAKPSPPTSPDQDPDQSVRVES